MDFTPSDEQRMLVDTVRAFVEKELTPHEAEVERTNQVRPELIAEIRRKAKAAGLYAANMPEDLGGGGLDAVSMALVERELGRTSFALQYAVARPSNILRACKGEQIERYLLPAVRGERVECLALSEPGAGTRLAQGQALHPLATNGGQQIALDLLALAGPQDVGGPRHGVLEREGGATQLPLDQRHADRIQPAAAQVFRHIGGIEAGGLGLAPDLGDQFGAHLVDALDLRLMGRQLLLDESADCVDQHALFVAGREIHGPISRGERPAFLGRRASAVNRTSRRGRPRPAAGSPGTDSCAQRPAAPRTSLVPAPCYRWPAPA